MGFQVRVVETYFSISPLRGMRIHHHVQVFDVSDLHGLVGARWSNASIKASIGHGFHRR